MCVESDGAKNSVTDLGGLTFQDNRANMDDVVIVLAIFVVVLTAAVALLIRKVYSGFDIGVGARVAFRSSTPPCTAPHAPCAVLCVRTLCNFDIIFQI